MVRKFITEGWNISGWLGLVSALILVPLGIWFFTGEPEASTPPVTSDQARPSLPLPEGIQIDLELVDEELVEVSRPGGFGDFDEQYLASLSMDSRVILFFTSVQCSSCQRAESSILANQTAIPEDVHILLVDYTTSPALRRRYEVTVPHTFVEITADGTFIQSWRASRDLQAILARL